MSKSWVIVAIPEEDDVVWKVSSEKVPHLTILFLGEQEGGEEKAAHIVEYLRHVAKTSLPRFGMSVDRRGELGDENADVLFFEKEWAKNAQEFRNYLLKDNVIKSLYDSAFQYPEWTPHLTLGYPETPAKDLPLGFNGIHWVNFDRLALWTGDFEGTEILLEKDRSYAVDEMAMNEGSLGKVLKHYGVLGMRWGFRRKVGSDGRIDKASKPVPSGKKPAEKNSEEHQKSADHDRAAKAYAKAQEKGLQSLSNDELRSITNRVKVEKEFHQLSSDQKSDLQRKVDELKLMDEYRKYKSKDIEARKSTGRKLVDALLQSAMKAASEQASEYGSQLVKDMLNNTGTSKRDFGIKTKPKTKGTRDMPFKVNPDKVKISRPTSSVSRR